MVGKTLGHYEILEPLGAGGMGEVYLGEDTRLGRKVAIKVLPEEYASDPGRLARFEQEARAAAALNHPHIAVIHDIGFEPQAEGTPTGIHYMVQEHLEGQTLSDALGKGRLPLKKALDLCTEIAEALSAAHAAGIVHRDLKPANVFVSLEGHAKVLDFGLAKLTEAVMLSGDAGGSGSHSPTLLGTAAGQVMGTAGYMAPEQAEGEEVDHRADTFAFGCLLYETVTGKQAFAGKNVLDTLHKIANSEPQPLAEIDQQLPLDLQRILQKCLAKEPSARYQTAGDLAVDLKRLASEVESGAALPLNAVSTTMPQAHPGSAGGQPTSGRGVSIGLAAALMLVAGLTTALAVWTLTRQPTPAATVYRFQVPAPGLDRLLSRFPFPFLQIAPDGSDLFFSAALLDGSAGLYRRPLDGFETRPIPGAVAGAFPVVSPDGEWIIVQNNDGELARMSVLGGEPFVLAEGAAGADWLDNETIVYIAGLALMRVAAAGGEAEQIVEIQGQEGRVYVAPVTLPGNEHVLLVEFGAATPRIVAVSLETGAIDAIVVPTGIWPRYVETGHVIYQRGTTVEAVAFDAAGPRVLGTPVPVIADAFVPDDNSAAQIAVSRTGTLAYLTGAAQGVAGRTLTWVNRNGDANEIFPIAGEEVQRPRLSPDGTSVALVLTANGEQQLRVYDLTRGSFVPLPHAGVDWDPIWTPDGQSIVFNSARDGVSQLYMRSADGTGDELALPTADLERSGYSWSPNGELAVYTRPPEGGAERNIAVLSPDDNWSPRVILETSFNERSPAFSPDGRWLAYASDQGGRTDIYALSYPALDNRVSISTNGGRAPAWSADGSELYYISRDNQMMAVPIEAGTTLVAGRPEELFSLSGYALADPSSGSRPYDVAADGRFLLLRDPQLDTATSPMITVVVNWFEELKQLVPRR